MEPAQLNVVCHSMYKLMPELHDRSSCVMSDSRLSSYTAKALSPKFMRVRLMRSALVSAECIVFCDERRWFC